MTNQLNKRPVGIEIEFSLDSNGDTAVRKANRSLVGTELEGKMIFVKDHNCIEANVAPTIIGCNAQREYYKKMYSHIESIGGTVTHPNGTAIKICSTHVHISTKTIKDGITATEFTEFSIANWFSNKTAVLAMLNDEELDPQIAWDILYRCTAPSLHGGKKDMDSMIPRDRRNGGYTYNIDHAKLISNETDRNDIASIKRCQRHYKFSEISLDHWVGKNTIEFRQHGGTLEEEKITNWCKFLLNIFVTSIETRFDHSANRTVTAPDDLGLRRGTKQQVLYHAIKGTSGGISVRDIHAIVGTNTDQAVRRLISDITGRLQSLVGTEQLMICHTQRTNGGRYRDGTDISSYEVLEELTIDGSGVTPKPENRTGQPSIWSNCPDDVFEYQRGRIAHFASRS